MTINLLCNKTGELLDSIELSPSAILIVQILSKRYKLSVEAVIEKVLTNAAKA